MKIENIARKHTFTQTHIYIISHTLNMLSKAFDVNYMMFSITLLLIITPTKQILAFNAQFPIGQEIGLVWRAAQRIATKIIYFRQLNRF